MAKRKSGNSVRGSEANLRDAGWINDENSAMWYSPDDERYERPLSFNEASALYVRQTADEKPQRKEIQRVPRDVIQTVRSIAQYLSTGKTARGAWGDEEFNLKTIVTAVVSAYAQVSARSNGTIEPVSASMVKNAVNGLKRDGEIVGVRKGWFHAAEGANVDWSSFIM